MFFYGRRRSGFPGLLMAIVTIVLALTLLFRFRAGVEVSRWIGLAPIVLAVLLLVLALIVTLFGLVRPRGKQ
jgi:hypothetical protein